MKVFLRALFSFSRMERLGIAVLVVLLTIYCAMPLLVHSKKEISNAEQARLSAAYKLWKEKQEGFAADTTSNDTRETQLFAFDPNILDSAGFLRLGMPQRAVSSLLNWRRKGKRFYKPEDLKPLYNLPEDVYARLEPYIRIDAAAGAGNATSYAFNNNFPEIPAVIDLNTADSAMLDRGLPGIGAALAHRIIQRRAALGGFIGPEQLLEVYKFPDTTFQKMKEKLRINPASVKKLDLNTVTLTQLSAHPYIGEKAGRNILLYREGIKRYESVEQLRQVPLMNEEIYRKIAPYFAVGSLTR
jgi:DNA uptake protein ComE-like DNA-binding protein